MQKVKIFVDDNPQAIEDAINEYLSEHKTLKVLNIFATESVVDGTSWTTVYLLLV